MMASTHYFFDDMATNVTAAFTGVTPKAFRLKKTILDTKSNYKIHGTK